MTAIFEILCDKFALVYELVARSYVKPGAAPPPIGGVCEEIQIYKPTATGIIKPYGKHIATIFITDETIIVALDSALKLRADWRTSRKIPANFRKFDIRDPKFAGASTISQAIKELRRGNKKQPST